MSFFFVFLSVFLIMEFVAWFSHKYVMHGKMWCWHASHHEPRRGPFEKNDLFAFFFAAVSIALFAAGYFWHRLFIAAGAGMTAYGAAYFFFHDILNHRRFGIRVRPRGRYLKAVVRSHRIHHARQEKDGCVSFGFLVPMRLPRRGQAPGESNPLKKQELAPGDLEKTP